MITSKMVKKKTGRNPEAETQPLFTFALQWKLRDIWFQFGILTLESDWLLAHLRLFVVGAVKCFDGNEDTSPTFLEGELVRFV